MTDRKKLLASASDAETATLLSHLYDLCIKAEKTGKPFFSDFLSPAEALMAKTAFFNKADVPVSFFGGYDGAERVMVCFGEAEKDMWPIAPLEIVTKNSSELSHRACLGTVLSLGLKRLGVGDIVVSGNRAIAFASAHFADFISQNITKIGGTGVKLKILDEADAAVPQRQYKEKETSLSSMRLDCVVSAAVGKSRSAASSLIDRALVFVNYKEITSQSYTVCDGDVITIRGEGKFLIQTDNRLTRKGRIFVKILKYI